MYTEKDLIAVIPAAGKGSRLGLPYPKELYPIVNQGFYKPLSQFVLEAILQTPTKRIVFVINETKQQIMNYYGNGSKFGCEIIYVFQEEKPLENSKSSGLAQALGQNGFVYETRIVVFGMADTILTPKTSMTYALNKLTDWDIVLGLYPIENKKLEKSAIVTLNSEKRVLSIIDKPTTQEYPEIYKKQNLGWSFIIWKPAFTKFLTEQLNSNPLIDFNTILNNASKELNMGGIEINGNYLDLGSYDDLLEFHNKNKGI